MCEEQIPDVECFKPSCSNITLPRSTKKCQEVFDEKCQVIIEEQSETQCKDVESTEYVQECKTENEKQCNTVQEYKCEDETTVAPVDSYGVPKVILW